MSQKEKTIRDLDPRDIKLSTIAKFFGGIWSLITLLAFLYGVVAVIAVSMDFILGYSNVIYPAVLGGMGAAIAFAELKYKFIKPTIQKIFS